MSGDGFYNTSSQVQDELTQRPNEPIKFYNTSPQVQDELTQRPHESIEFYNTSPQVQDELTQRPHESIDFYPNLCMQKSNAPPTTPQVYRVCHECNGAVDTRNGTNCLNYSSEKGACVHNLGACCGGSCYGWFSTTGKFTNEKVPLDLQLAESQILVQAQQILQYAPRRGYGGGGNHYGQERGNTSRHAKSR
jgi:hypothetical protein